MSASYCYLFLIDLALHELALFFSECQAEVVKNGQWKLLKITTVKMSIFYTQWFYRDRYVGGWTGMWVGRYVGGCTMDHGS
jgi:hypothetical protein